MDGYMHICIIYANEENIYNNTIITQCDRPNGAIKLPMRYDREIEF